jgi:hypothetical protein
LHPLYERVVAILKEDVPESAELLAQFEAFQEQYDLHLDADILQGFGGEHVAIAVQAAGGGPAARVLALRCSQPDRIRELSHRALAAVQRSEFPPVKALHLQLGECRELEGFEELSAPPLGMFSMRPVIGCRDGWMWIGWNAAAVKKVLDTKAGNCRSIEGTDAFQRLKLDVSGPVDSIAYADTAQQTRNIAKALGQIGFIVPMLMSMSGASASRTDLQPVQEFLAVLPDVARIVGKFDFLEAEATVVQSGAEPDIYRKRSVTVVRPLQAAATEATDSK